jgi:hypothetical protein
MEHHRISRKQLCELSPSQYKSLLAGCLKGESLRVHAARERERGREREIEKEREREKGDILAPCLAREKVRNKKSKEKLEKSSNRDI